MKLFQSFAATGKTLLCVTHNLANVERYCTHVCILSDGGRLAFFGSPTEARQYFKIPRIADVYRRLGEHSANAWETKFRTHKLFQQHIADRRLAIQSPASQSGGKKTSSRHTDAVYIRQCRTIVLRTTATWMNDRGAVVAVIGQPILVDLLLCCVFEKFDNIAEQPSAQRALVTQNFLFLLNVSCFWLGCKSGVKELVREQEIYGRERDFNLIPESYLGAKLWWFSILGTAQAFLLGIVALAWYSPPGSPVGFLASLMMITLVGTGLGNAISANTKSEETAIALVPVTIIPQIILGGVVAPLSGMAAWLARPLVSVYWGQHLLNQRLDEVDQVPLDFSRVQAR